MLLSYDYSHSYNLQGVYIYISKQFTSGYNMSNSTTTAGSYGIHHTSGTWGRSAILPAMPRPGPAPDVGVRDFGRSSEMNGEGCGM